MRRKIWPLLTLILVLLVLGGVFLFKKINFLQLENLDRKTTLQIRVSPTEPFSLFYTHSIHLEPVIEEFRIKDETILLEGVRTKSPGVMEYYGFEDTTEFHPVRQKFETLYLRKGSAEEQGLIVKERKIYFSEIGEKGDRIRLRVVSMPLGYYFLRHFKT
ncbi:MAG: DUF1850 domain-containing protein [Deltaproteobacteria bacterium]|nr:DUF1850 domain-containing protein [Deltaproteobacteria bacterium]